MSDHEKTEKTVKRRLPWYGWVGLFTLLAGELGLFLGLFAVQVLFYCIAWWSYIVLADAWVWKRRGHSLLRDRPWEFLVLAFWSIAVWNLFEGFNFRIQNWFYVNVPTDILFGAIFTFFAYATVIPGIFETYDLLRAYGIADGVRMRPWRIRPSGIALALGIGLVMLVSPLLWPHYAFPWVWGFAVFLLDPVCNRAGRTQTKSLLGQFERGDPRPFLRLLLAGLICGGLWELWNFWAYTKWIYTVPFFEDLKWFEMPPMGFLGFPPFAVECYVFVNLLNRFRRGRGWEEPGEVGPGASRRMATVAVIIASLFNIAVYAGIDRLTVQSYIPTLADIEGVPGALVERLARLGIDSPPDLLRRTTTPGGLATLAQQAGIAEGELRAVRSAAELVDLKGLGAPHYDELRRLGIARVEDLALQEPEALVIRWRALGAPKPPTLSQVKVWVRAARSRTRAFDGSGVQ
ncbi:MAG: hypothetical protein A3H39_15760 [candidate division NC10 bacterium RIFCSPLOWO2_02_FULL_66_22]|nr:MAG: hypothetical protein A3H39_15760 [candidate division NC10 bacterium RIFCSPLOWO2_02_FULL_66_22]